MKPLAIDLYCGLGGWTEGFLAEGYDVVGFDIERHVYGQHKYPGQLVLQDVTTLHGSQFRDATVIVASPPCQAYSYRAMPWSRAKALPPPDNTLFDACFRIAREAGVPIVVENVKGAQRWVGDAKWHFGSFYLWGDVPALMPIAHKFKNTGGSWFNIAHNTTSGVGNNPVNNSGVKVPGNNKPRRWDERRVQRLRDVHRFPGDYFYFSNEGTKLKKFNSAQIAKIPLPLARWIARHFKPF